MLHTFGVHLHVSIFIFLDVYTYSDQNVFIASLRRMFRTHAMYIIQYTFCVRTCYQVFSYVSLKKSHLILTMIWWTLARIKLHLFMYTNHTYDIQIYIGICISKLTNTHRFCKIIISSPHTCTYTIHV